MQTRDVLDHGVEDFSLLYEPDPANELKIQFLMRNRSQTEKTVGGVYFYCIETGWE